jgi:hypothetical protein
MARREIDQEARVRDAWPILIARAHARDKLTYEELCNELGLHHRAARALLSVIRRPCDRKGLPNLQALAVSAETGLPGGGYRGTKVKAEHDPGT